MTAAVERARRDLQVILGDFETALRWLRDVEASLRRTPEFEATEDALDGNDPTDDRPGAWLLAGAASGAAEIIGEALADLRAELATCRDEATAAKRCAENRRESRDLEAEVAASRDRRFAPQSDGAAEVN